MKGHTEIAGSSNMVIIKQRWLGEFDGQVSLADIERYKREHRIPDVAVELHENRLIMKSVEVT